MNNYVSVGTQASAKQLMLGWIKALLPSWNINNFTSDWTDGRALLALIHEIKPDKCPLVATLDPRKNKSNCTLAIRTAKMYLKVPPIISPEAIVQGEVDEMSMMTYLSYFLKPASRSLLKWVKEVLPQRKITNLSTDWINGIAYAALINTLHQGLFPDWKSLPKETPLKNISLVIDMAHKHLGVQPGVDAASMASPEVEELHIATYILRLRNARLLSLPDEISVLGSGLSDCIVGKQTHFVIDTTKAGPGKLLVNAGYETGGCLDFSLQEKTAGVIKLTYTPPKAGKVSFDIFWSDHPVPNSPFVVSVSDSNLIRVADLETLQTVVHVLTRVKIKLDASSAQSGSLTASLLYPSEPPITPTITEKQRIYTIEFTPHKAGYPTLQTYWNKEQLKHCKIEYTVLDNRQYAVVNTPEEKTFRTFEEVSFSVESTGLPLHPLCMTAICGDIHIPLEFSKITGNTGKALFVPTLPGNYNLEVACVDRLVEGSPIIVQVIDPLKAVVLTKLPKHFALNRPYELTVNTKEAGNGEVQFKCLDELDTSGYFSVAVNSTQPNLVSVVVIPKEIGQFLATLTHSGVDIPGCPFRVTVCDPSSCSLTGDLVKKRHVGVGSKICFSISCPNWMGVRPAVRAHGPSAKYQTTISESGKNSYTGEFTPWEMGEHEVNVTLGGFPITGSPFHFTAIAVDTGVCSATGAGLQEVLTTIPAQFVVLAKQPGLIEQQNLEITVYGVVNNVQGTTRARDNRDGSYNIAYIVDTPGAYLIDIKAWGKHIPGSPFRMNALPGPDASKCEMYGPALDPAAVIKIGDPIDFSVNTIPAGTGKLTVAAVGPRGVQARVFIAKGDRPGIHDIKLDPLRAGKHRVGIKWSGSHIPGSPFILKIFPGADASKCRAYGPGLEDGKVGDPSLFTIETQDAGSGVLRVKLNGIKDAFKIALKPVSPLNARTLLAEYNPRKPGDYLITIKWSEKDVPGSPFKVKISGDAMEEPSGIRMATPLQPELSTIPEEVDSDEGSEPESLSTKSQPQIRAVKPLLKKKKEKEKETMKSSSTGALPVFKGMTPDFQNAFVTKQSKKAAKTMGTKGLLGINKDSLQQAKMMTFSKLQLTNKTYGSGTSANIHGRYSGQAHIQVNSVKSKNSVIHRH